MSFYFPHCVNILRPIFFPCETFSFYREAGQKVRKLQSQTYQRCQLLDKHRLLLSQTLNTCLPFEKPALVWQGLYPTKVVMIQSGDLHELICICWVCCASLNPLVSTLLFKTCKLPILVWCSKADDLNLNDLRDWGYLKNKFLPLVYWECIYLFGLKQIMLFLLCLQTGPTFLS